MLGTGWSTEAYEQNPFSLIGVLFDQVRSLPSMYGSFLMRSQGYACIDGTKRSTRMMKGVYVQGR